MHPSGEKNLLVDKVPNEVVGIGMIVAGAIFKCSGREISELTHYANTNERDWTNRGETVLKVGEMTRQVENRPVFSDLLSSHKTYFISPKTDAELILKERSVMKLRAQSWVTACMNHELQRRVLEAVSHSAVLRWKRKKNLADTCSMRK